MQSSLLWRNEPRSSRCYICLLQLLYGLTELGRERLSEEFRSLGKAGIAGEEFDMVHHAFIMFLYGMMAYALMSAIVVGFWGIRSLRFRQPEVTASNLEAAILGWLEDFGMRTKPASDPAWNFGVLTALPYGGSVHIIQMKERPGFVTFQANLAISAEHQAVLKALPIAYFEKLAQEVVLGVFLANMVLAIRTRLSDVSFFSQLAIRELTKGDLLRHLNDMDDAIILAREAILLGVERAPRLVSPRNIRMDKLR